MQNINNSNIETFNKDTGFNRSNRYVSVNTKDLADLFEKEGYQIRSIQSVKTRIKDKQGFQKHLIRMSHPDIMLNKDGLVPEVVLRNSYDGTSAFEVFMGIFRLVCANGLVVGDTFESVRIRHMGQDVSNKVLNACQSIQGKTLELGDQIERWTQFQLNESQVNQYARQISEYLVPEKESVLTQLRYHDLLTVNRSDDQGQDLWTVFNRVQENAMKGGMKLLRTNLETNKERANNTRPIRNVDKVINFNRYLWNFTEEFEKQLVA